MSRIFLSISLGVLLGCSDSSTQSNAVPISQSNLPVITKIIPDSLMCGDTLIIAGSHFGERHGISIVAIGDTTLSTILSWSDTLIVVVVPVGVHSGKVSITVEGRTSNGVPILITPRPPIMSFLNNVRPIFLLNNCINCHGGSGGLDVGTVDQLLQGGSDGPAIIPGKADSSLLIQKLSPNPPFGSRMPLRGPYLSDSLVNVIKLWINQGAKDN